MTMTSSRHVSFTDCKEVTLTGADLNRTRLRDTPGLNTGGSFEQDQAQICPRVKYRSLIDKNTSNPLNVPLFLSHWNYSMKYAVRH